MFVWFTQKIVEFQSTFRLITVKFYSSQCHNVYSICTVSAHPRPWSWSWCYWIRWMIPSIDTICINIIIHVYLDIVVNGSSDQFWQCHWRKFSRTSLIDRNILITSQIVQYIITVWQVSGCTSRTALSLFDIGLVSHGEAVHVRVEISEKFRDWSQTMSFTWGTKFLIRIYSCKATKGYSTNCTCTNLYWKCRTTSRL